MFEVGDADIKLGCAPCKKNTDRISVLPCGGHVSACCHWGGHRGRCAARRAVRTWGRDLRFFPHAVSGELEANVLEKLSQRSAATCAEEGNKS